MALQEQETKSKEQRIILQVENVSKSFPGVQALDNVSFHIKEGEVLAILGENGAGKSTLMKILSGLYHADSGTIKINRSWFDPTSSQDRLEEIFIKDPRLSMKLGIGMVYQHFKLVEPFTVLDNITLGKEFRWKSTMIIDQNEAEERITELSKNYGMPIDPLAKVENLSVGIKQRVEILKQLYRDAQLLILDEPTAVLTPTEADELFKTIKRLKARGKSIIFITHKLREPLAVADRIIVLRKGKYVGEVLPKDANQEILAEMVVGERVFKQIDRKDLPLGKNVLTVKNLSVHDKITLKPVVKDISFELHEHEILGIAGVMGNGQSELVEALIGINRLYEGSILLKKGESTEDITHYSTLQRLKLDIGFIPEDRVLRGLVLELSLTENIWMGYFGQPERNYAANNLANSEEEKEEEKSELRKLLGKISSILFIPYDLIASFTKRIVKNYNVMATSVHQQVKDLSGGNQQKVILGRELSKNPMLIIASEPTRGVDIGVMTRIHKELIDRRNKGAAILLVSSDLDEILTLSDRIAVMYEGEVVGIKPTKDFPVSEISQLMTRGKSGIAQEVTE